MKTCKMAFVYNYIHALVGVKGMDIHTYFRHQLHTHRRVAQAKIRTKFGSFRGTRRAELAQIVTAPAEMPIRRIYFWSSRNREKAKT